MKVTNDNTMIHAVGDLQVKTAVSQGKATGAIFATQDTVLLSEEAQHRARVAELKTMVQGGQDIVNPQRIAHGIVTDLIAGSL